MENSPAGVSGPSRKRPRQRKTALSVYQGRDLHPCYICEISGPPRS